VLPERYANVERIGSGGMGDIVRAEDTSLGRTVAVKLLAERYAADESVRARFTREALAAARVSASPHTVTIFDVGEWEGRPYIVMEYMPGGSLADRLAAGGAQPPGKVLGWLEGAAEALDAAHRRGVVHRDVKPGNLLLDDDDNVKVADFGIASAAGTDSLTQDGMVLGTAGYLSPEQARGEPTTPASDRYALGVVAYELLSGRRPFERDSPTAEAAAHANDPHPAISKRRGDLPRSLDAVFDRALAKDPRERHGSCGELVADLRAALRADAGPTWVMAPPPPPPPVSEPRPAAGRRRSVLPLAAGLVALLGLGGVALAAVLSGDDPPPAETRVRESTVERTVTSEGQTVTVTTTTQAKPPPEEDNDEESPPNTSEQPAGDPAALNDEGFARMQAGDYEGALPLLEQAVAASQGSGTLTEAYASYNLAFTRAQLGSCDGVVILLDRSEQVQGERKEIDRLRRQAEKRC
jgi:serine/threonine protein kinase